MIEEKQKDERNRGHGEWGLEARDQGSDPGEQRRRDQRYLRTRIESVSIRGKGKYSRGQKWNGLS